MYLPQANDDSIKFVNLSKRSLGKGAGVAIGIIFFILLISFFIGICSSSSKKPESTIPNNIPPCPPQPVQMQQNSQSYLTNTFQGPFIINNINHNNNETTERTIPAEPTNQSEYPDDNVPPYTENTTENDMGYYDSQGVFQDSVQAPPMAHMRY